MKVYHQRFANIKLRILGEHLCDCGSALITDFAALQFVTTTAGRRNQLRIVHSKAHLHFPDCARITGTADLEVYKNDFNHKQYPTRFFKVYHTRKEIPMSELERKMIDALSDVAEDIPDAKKEYILGYAEAVADMKKKKED